MAYGLPERREAERREVRGPRADAPEQARQGFARKHGTDAAALEERDGFVWVVSDGAPAPAAELVPAAIVGGRRGPPASAHDALAGRPVLAAHPLARREARRRGARRGGGRREGLGREPRPASGPRARADRIGGDVSRRPARPRRDRRRRRAADGHRGRDRRRRRMRRPDGQARRGRLPGRAPARPHGRVLGGLPRAPRADPGDGHAVAPALLPDPFSGGRPRASVPGRRERRGRRRRPARERGGAGGQARRRGVRLRARPQARPGRDGRRARPGQLPRGQRVARGQGGPARAARGAALRGERPRRRRP